MRSKSLLALALLAPTAAAFQAVRPGGHVQHHAAPATRLFMAGLDEGPSVEPKLVAAPSPVRPRRGLMKAGSAFAALLLASARPAVARAASSSQFAPGLGIVTLPGLRGIASPYEMGAFVRPGSAVVFSSSAVLASAALLGLAGRDNYSRLVRAVGDASPLGGIVAAWRWTALFVKCHLLTEEGPSSGLELDGRTMMFVPMAGVVEKEEDGAEARSPFGGIAAAWRWTSLFVKCHVLSNTRSEAVGEAQPLEEEPDSLEGILELEQSMALKLAMDSEAEELGHAFAHAPSDTDAELRALERESQEYEDTVMSDLYKSRAKSGRMSQDVNV